jgi:hypothetical protein
MTKPEYEEPPTPTQAEIEERIKAVHDGTAETIRLDWRAHDHSEYVQGCYRCELSAYEESQGSCQCTDDCGCGEEPVPGLTVCACCLADCPHVHPTHNH